MTDELTLDDKARKLLGKLAHVLMPLDEWLTARMATKDGYCPPNADNPEKFPWRHGGQKLSTDQLRVVDFIQALIRESSGDFALLDRWKSLDDDPLKFCPIHQPSEWRAARGLDARVKFGAVESENAPGTLGGAPIPRARLYSEYLPLVHVAADARKLKDDDLAGWKTFMLDLFKNQCREWPEPESHPSSKFMLQLVRDVVYAVLGMRNAIDEPWRSAVLAEIGEFRRPGNKYDREAIGRGLEEFKREFDDVLARGVPPERGTVPDFFLKFNKW